MFFSDDKVIAPPIR